QSISCDVLSEVQPQGELNLARIEYSAGRSIVGVRRAFQETLGGRATLCRGIKGTKVCRAVHSIEEAHVHGVKNVESLGCRFHTQLFRRFECARQTEIHRLVAIS